MSKKETIEKESKAKVSISREILNEAGPKNKAIRNQPAECVGCGDKPNTEFAEGHMALTLVTENQLDRSNEGKFAVRCMACKNEFDNRKKNSKTLISLRDSIWKIDEVLAASQEYELTTDQVNTLQKERKYCIGEIQKGFATEKEAQDFIAP